MVRRRRASQSVLRSDASAAHIEPFRARGRPSPEPEPSAREAHIADASDRRRGPAQLVLSAWRPGHGSPAEHVAVDVEHMLLRVRAGVEHQPVAGVRHPFELRDRAGGREHRAGQRRLGAAIAAASAWWCLGTTSTCAGACGSRSRNAKMSSVSCTTVAGTSPATIRQNKQSADTTQPYRDRAVPGAPSFHHLTSFW